MTPTRDPKQRKKTKNTKNEQKTVLAFGAVLAAEWINNKKGIFLMNDVLNLK